MKSQLLNFFLFVTTTMVILLLSISSSSSPSLFIFVSAQASTSNMFPTGDGSSKMVYVCVKDNLAKFSTDIKKKIFTDYLKSGVLNRTLGSSAALLSADAKKGLYSALGTVEIQAVVEVNDTYTNLNLFFSNRYTGDAVVQAVNSASYNAVKKTGIVVATEKGPQPPAAEPRTMLFGGIVAISLVFSAGLSAFIVRRLAISKHEKKNRANKDMANLEQQLVREQMKQMGGGGSFRNNKQFGGGNANNVMMEQDPEMMNNMSQNYFQNQMQEFPGAHVDVSQSGGRSKSQLSQSGGGGGARSVKSHRSGRSRRGQ